MRIKVWYNDIETKEEGCSRILRNLKPRRYMTGWNFDKLVNYIKEEIEWEDIQQESITEIVILNEKEQWQQVITRA